MNLSKIFLSFIIFSLTCHMLFDKSCYAIDTGKAPIMDLKSSILELQALVKNNSPGIVSVSVYDDTGALKNSGSGFFIDKEGRIITNASIWKDAYSAEVLSESENFSEISIINRNDELDIALIRVKTKNENPLEPDFNYKTSLGERVVIIGKSDGLATTVSEGLVSSLSEEDFELFEIRTTASILRYRPGKDGPVLNTSGKVIGITGNPISGKKISDGIWGGFNNDQMYAVGLQPIKSVLADSAHTEQLHPAKSKVWFKWFASSLKSKALNGFLYLYDIGFSKIIAFLFVIMLILYIFEQVYVKYIKPKYGR